MTASAAIAATGTERRTVILLGAGASNASEFHLPTMAQFFLNEDQLGGEAKAFLKWYYPKASPNEYNLEDVLAYLDTARTRTQLWGLNTRGTQFGKAYDEVISFIKARLTVPAASVCLQHMRLFRQLRQLDSVLTLNYDLVADVALAETESRHEASILDRGPADITRWEKVHQLIGRVVRASETPPGLTPDERTRGFYLKLHGSLNWVVCPTPGCENNLNWFVEYPDDPNGPQAGRPCRNCGATLETLIVPPLATKRIQDRGRLAAVWRTALDELSLCTDLVMYGVSLAPSDADLRWLLRHSFGFDPDRTATIHVINIADDVCKTLRSMFSGRIRVEYYRGGLEDYWGRNPAWTFGHND